MPVENNPDTGGDKEPSEISSEPLVAAPPDPEVFASRLKLMLWVVYFTAFLKSVETSKVNISRLLTPFFGLRLRR
jgi:hypothetical protein